MTFGEQTATEGDGRQPARRAHVGAAPVRVDPAELRWRIVDELATNDYVIPHCRAFLPWRSAFLAVPRHVLTPDTVWVKNDAGLVPLHRTDDPQRWLDLTYAGDSVITQVDGGHPVGPGLIGEARFAYNAKGQQSYARAYCPFPSAGPAGNRSGQHWKTGGCRNSTSLVP